MRKLILISALLLATGVAAQAGETRSLSLAGVAMTEPAKPITATTGIAAQAIRRPMRIRRALPLRPATA